jgi:hypothetical protein
MLVRPRSASLLIAVLLLQIAAISPASAQPLTGHSSTDDVLDGLFIGTIGQGRIGNVVDPSDPELVLGQQLASPLSTGSFFWISGRSYDWRLDYQPGSFGGVMRFSVGGVILSMGTLTPFDLFFIRTAALQPDTSIVVSNISLGPAISEGLEAHGLSVRRRLDALEGES